MQNLEHKLVERGFVLQKVSQVTDMTSERVKINLNFQASNIIDNGNFRLNAKSDCKELPDLIVQFFSQPDGTIKTLV